MLRLVTVGHVDHGKSTLVARLLEATGRASLEGLREPAFLLDAFEEERAQGVTIDTAQVFLPNCTIFDAPGHREFVKNMVCGAAQADAALLVVAADEGIREQTRTHAALLRFLGIEQVLVVINKIDLTDDPKKIDGIAGELGWPSVAVSAREGRGIDSVLAAIAEFRAPAPPSDRPLRFALQGVYKFDDRRIFAGRVEQGRLRVGDPILFSPSNKTAVVRTLESGGAVAEAGESIGFTLEEPVFVERGEVVSHEADAPVETDGFRARVFWMGRQPLSPCRDYVLSMLTQEVECTVDGELSRHEFGSLTIRTARPIAVDEASRFVLVSDRDVCGGGTVSELVFPDHRPTAVRSTNITWEPGLVSNEDRAAQAGHEGVVVWMTGLSGAGKSTLARHIEKQLFDRGIRTYRLDGDNVRHGLNADLGFTPDDRAENIRRIAEVANLFADAGVVVLTSFISPYRHDRRHARGIIQAGRFVEVYVDCPLAECERRDPKGLYKRARAGEIASFTGVSAPYEPPLNAEIAVDTSETTPEQAAAYVIDQLRLPS